MYSALYSKNTVKIKALSKIPAAKPNRVPIVQTQRETLSG